MTRAKKVNARKKMTSASNRGAGTDQAIEDSMEVEVLPSAALAESSASRAELIAEFSRRRAARAISVPASEQDVRTGLRSFGLPVCLFGEDLYDRRERLRAAMANAMSNPEETQDSGASTAPIGAANGAAPDPKQATPTAPEADAEFYTTGSEEVLQLRLALAGPTLVRAHRRLEAERLLRASDDAHDDAKVAFQAAEAKTVECVRSAQMLCSQIGDRRPLSAICIASDPRGAGSSVAERLVVTGSWGGTVKVWGGNADAPLLQTLEDHEARISNVSIPLERPDVLLTCSADMTARLYRCSEVQETSPKASELKTSAGLYRCETTFSGHTHRVSDVRLNPARTTLVVTSSYDGTLRLFDGEKLILTQPTGHKGVQRIAFHPDGSLLGTCGLEGGLRIWDMRSGRSIMTMGKAHVGAATSVDFSRDGRVLCSAAIDNTVKIWDLRRQRCARVIPAHMRLVSAAKFGGDGGDVLVSASFDRSVRIWSCRRNWAMLKAHTSHMDKVTAVDCTPDARYIVSACYDKTWKLWAAPAEQPQADPPS